MALMEQAQARATQQQPPAPEAPAAGPGPAAGDQGGDTGGTFKRPDISQFVPPEQADAVQRIAAAGMKLMYSPQMRQELMQEVHRQVPVPQKLAEGVVGLMLTLDKQSQGGIPAQALFPAAMELLGEAAEVLSAAGQQVTQQDYNDAARLMFVLIARKLGAKDNQIMGAAQKIAGGQPDVGAGGTGAPPEPDEGAPAEEAAPDEEQEPA